VKQIVDRAGDLRGQHKADHDRDELDDHEQTRRPGASTNNSSCPKLYWPRPTGESTEVRSNTSNVVDHDAGRDALSGSPVAQST
jgi:hypothetical protein